MQATSHFDRRGPGYDAGETHRRIVTTLVAGAHLRPGMSVLDLATGTGAAALLAAQQVGPTGSVLGIDLSEGMLTEARRKAAAAGLANITFLQADAERTTFPPESFDLLLCASALIMMQDIPAALRLWSHWLKPGGSIAFEMPAKPFGVAQWIAEAAAPHGILLPYDTAADTPAKCRALLEQAGFEVLSITTQVVGDHPMAVDEAIAFLDDRLDHPAWRLLQEATPQKREAIRTAYRAMLTRKAIAGQVPNPVAQNFAYGRKS